jgi:EF-P beta-lysylation protein EpmB
MITRTPPSWQQSLAESITSPARLLELLELPPSLLDAAQRAARLFPLRVPRGYALRMAKGDPDDPLLRQVLPIGAEERPQAGFVDDPVGDLEAMRIPGLVHKYHGRVLLTATGACAVHCRYCFRRHFPYGAANPARAQWREALNYIAADPTIVEVILSGGDPLTLADGRLTTLTEGLSRLPHVRRLRIHTRLPVVLPERVDAGLLEWLAGCRQTVVMVLHANHPNELDAEVAAALRRLSGIGVRLLNQAVLLRGVNDSVQALMELGECLFEQGVLPYYLHLLDRVRGAAHFEVPEQRALELYGDLSRHLAGYLVPRLVREIPGAPAKIGLPAGQHSAAVRQHPRPPSRRG